MSESSRRRGYSLIECLVLITVMSLLIGLSAGTIQLLLKLDRAGRTASEEAVALARLARDFRDDAHEAAPVDPPGRSPDRIVLPLGESKTV
jgi:type II secretory pathway pseudopilin PulG